MEIETKKQIRNRQSTRKPTRNPRRCRKLRKSCIIPIAVFVLGGFIWCGIQGYKLYCNPTIEGKWVSQETGSTVEFTKRGNVKVNRKQTGTYNITTPDTMTYQIENHTFTMDYKINQRNLTWKVAGEEDEIFDRKEKWIQLGLDIFS